jgi:hypothetical protein
MDDRANLVSKVLVLDESKACHEKIKAFCEEARLIGVKTQTDKVMSVLKSNVDLGCIFLSEAFDGKADGGLRLGREIHEVRPDLPIFLRREHSASLKGLSDIDQKNFSAAYTMDRINDLKSAIHECIFSLAYPNALVRGIAEMTKAALESQFKGLATAIETPYIVRDRLIFGEIYTLIPIEGSWCRGYMTLQAEEAALMKLVQSDKTHFSPESADDFRNLNGVLGEITNLIWGSFKNRYITTDAMPTFYLSQVPIVINHKHRYISFGSENPQLCFQYTLTDRSDQQAKPVSIYQRFVFNLNWSPEDFSENVVSVDDLFKSGELELF